MPPLLIPLLITPPLTTLRYVFALQAQVLRLIDFSASHNGDLLQAVKHWGWSEFHKSSGYAMANESHYEMFGPGKRDQAWEKEKIGLVSRLRANPNPDPERQLGP